MTVKRPRPTRDIPNSMITHCPAPECGKRVYASKAEAKRANRRAHPEDRMNAYRCPHPAPWDAERWHLGHLQPGDRRADEQETAA